MIIFSIVMMEIPFKDQKKGEIWGSIRNINAGVSFGVVVI